mgnify:CR=1 FL=1
MNVIDFSFNPTLLTEWICPQWKSQGQTHCAMQITNLIVSQMNFLL